MTLEPALLRRVWSNRQLRQRLADDEAGSGGSGSPGAPIVRKFPFAFDSPGISAPVSGFIPGYPVYTPTVGDLLLNFWFEISTAWDGTSPVGDIGDFAQVNLGGLHAGWLAGFNTAGWPGIEGLDMTQHDLVGFSAVSSLAVQPQADLTMMQVIDSAQYFYEVPAASALTQPLNLIQNSNPMPQATRLLPARWTTADPVKVVVSQDGLTTGADPGSTQGAAALYLMTVTPA